MIDRESRVIAVHLLTEFQNGAISITTLDERWPRAGTDAALIAIQATLLLAFYDDHVALHHGFVEQGKRRLVERCISYLRSERRYSGTVGIDHEHHDAQALDVHPEERFGEESRWPFSDDA